MIVGPPYERRLLSIFDASGISQTRGRSVVVAEVVDALAVGLRRVKIIQTIITTLTIITTMQLTMNINIILLLLLL